MTLVSRLYRIRPDALAGTAAFCVAVPLSLGIAHASGAPLISGLLGSIIGTLVISLFSSSPYRLVAPSATLAVVFLAIQQELGSFQSVLAASVLAGVFQLVLARMGAASIARFFPSSVLQGVLTALGILLIIKQLPHWMGYDFEEFGVLEMSDKAEDLDETYNEPHTEEKNGFTLILHAFQNYNKTAWIIGVTTLSSMLLWDFFRPGFSRWIPAPILGIVLGIAAQFSMESFLPAQALNLSHLVKVPLTTEWAAHFQTFFPTWEYFINLKVVQAAFWVALAASLESLINIEAFDWLGSRGSYRKNEKLDLSLQGVAHIISGFLGALPATVSVPLNSVNAEAGARTRWSSLFHGLLLIFALTLLPGALSHIPLATLAAVLMYIGFKLISVPRLKHKFKEEWTQFIPFAATVIAILSTHFLTGMVVGLIVAGALILKNTSQSTDIHVQDYGKVKKILFGEDVTFLQKSALRRTFQNIPNGSVVEVDGTHAKYIDPDIIGEIRNFRESSESRSIQVIVGGIPQLETVSSDILITMQEKYDKLLSNNQEWIQEKLQQDPKFFEKSATGQTPQFLFIGCSDSRVPFEVITKSEPGDIFVHRNIANLVSLTDINILSVLQYSVEVLNVRHIIVCGHYECGGVKAALKNRSLGLIDNWISQIKFVVKHNAAELERIPTEAARERRVIELSVIQQVRNLHKTSIVQNAIKKYGFPFIHGCAYDLSTGKINDLKVDLSIEKDFHPVFKYD